jgi:hypothetical protein
MKRFACAAMLLTAVLWMSGCGGTEPKQPGEPTGGAPPAKTAAPKKKAGDTKPAKRLDEPEPAESGAPSKDTGGGEGQPGGRVVGAMGKALLKAVTGGPAGSDEKAPPPQP